MIDDLRRPRRLATAALGILMPLVLVASASGIAIELHPVNNDPDINEKTPSASGDWIAWTANSKSRPQKMNAFVKQTGEAKMKVNPAGTSAEAGGFNGTTFLWTEWSGNTSADIWQIDLATDERAKFGSKVNTKHDEFQPTSWGPWLLFSRYKARTNTYQVLLYNTENDSLKVLASSDKVALLAGQINGDVAAWERFRTNGSDVIRYDVTNGDVLKLPNSNVWAYAPGGAEDGTVFYARSSGGCGKNVDLLRYPVAGPVEKVRDLSKGDDVGSIYVHDKVDGFRDVLFSRIDCDGPKPARRWDNYKLQDSYTLTVVKEGTGDGTVTSDPSGAINCGTDCVQVIPRGGSIVLVANADADSIIDGWSVPGCELNLQCEVPITGDITVTVEFRFLPT